MAKNEEVSRVAREFGFKGYAQTSYGGLGLPFDSDLAGNVCTAITDVFGRVAEHVRLKEMPLPIDEAAIVIGHELVGPAIRLLFPSNDEQAVAMTGFDLIDKSDKGHGTTVRSRQGSIGKTVLEVTLLGSRELTIYKHQDPEVQQPPDKEKLDLEPGSIVILGPQSGWYYSATSEEPSISVMFDVLPGTLRQQ